MSRGGEIGRGRGPEPQPLIDEGGETGAFLEAANTAFEPRLGEEAQRQFLGEDDRSVRIKMRSTRGGGSGGALWRVGIHLRVVGEARSEIEKVLEVGCQFHAQRKELIFCRA